MAHACSISAAASAAPRAISQRSAAEASATALPFADATFDGAYMLHVGMNIPDKKAVFAEVRRVLRPGGVFAIYDAMRESDGAFSYPVPWWAGPETNFIDTASAYRRLLGEAGFSIDKERNRRDFALESFRQRQRMAQAQGAAPQPGLQIVMGPTAPQKIANMMGLLERGVISPTEIISSAA
ncbi:MAG: class I SAM-dependent methyltransferase [Alphaproteobacteria bacterium]|nr:class I SAM-dependent methyltransferase [Alphaproteobacteria bacterium]